MTESRQENAVGHVDALWRFPVKSMLGERLAEARVREDGIPGDRSYALVDVKTGKIVTAKEIRRFPGLFSFRARLSAAAGDGGAPLAAVIVMPDGRELNPELEEAAAALTAHFGREVRLLRCDARESGSTPASGPFHDAAPVSVLTHSTLRRMNELQPGSIFDARRFRMNIILECDEPGFLENDWIGRELRIGDEIRLRVTRHDARCVMTTLAQEELPEDRGILAGLGIHNRLEVEGGGRYPCAGVYARVVQAGIARLGDRVILD